MGFNRVQRQWPFLVRRFYFHLLNGRLVKLLEFLQHLLSFVFIFDSFGLLFEFDFCCTKGDFPKYLLYKRVDAFLSFYDEAHRGKLTGAVTQDLFTLGSQNLLQQQRLELGEYRPESEIKLLPYSNCITLELVGPLQISYSLRQIIASKGRKVCSIDIFQIKIKIVDYIKGDGLTFSITIKPQNQIVGTLDLFRYVFKRLDKLYNGHLDNFAGKQIFYVRKFPLYLIRRKHIC